MCAIAARFEPRVTVINMIPPIYIYIYIIYILNFIHTYILYILYIKYMYYFPRRGLDVPARRARARNRARLGVQVRARHDDDGALPAGVWDGDGGR